MKHPAQGTQLGWAEFTKEFAGFERDHAGTLGKNRFR
jgi:hypothetical protein